MMNRNTQQAIAQAEAKGFVGIAELTQVTEEYRLAKAAQILDEVYDEFEDKSTEFCLAIAQDRIEMEELGVSVYDVL